MSLIRAVVSVVSIFLGLSAAVAQQAGTATNNAAASASSALTNPPVFQGLIVDAKGKTVGRLFVACSFPFQCPLLNPGVVRQIKGIWVLLSVVDFNTGFLITDPADGTVRFFYQSADCTGQAYLSTNPFAGDPTPDIGPVIGVLMVVPPATAPSIYFAGPLTMTTFQSSKGSDAAHQPCAAFGISIPATAGLLQSVPLSSLGLTLPFSIK